MERSETRQLVAAARDAHAQGQRVALATVVGVRGSAYRREGACMLVREDGAQTCMLSGGCLEPEVVAVAQEVLERGEGRVVQYDLSEDVVWGLGIGCGGSVDILIEPLTGDPLLEAWLDVLEAEEAAVLATPLRGAAGRLLVRADGRTDGALGVGSEHLTAEAVRQARALLDQAEPVAGPLTLAVDGREVALFLGVSTPAPELVIFGAGHDALPLARLAFALGWDVRVVDAREAFLTPGRFPGATLQLAEPDALHDHVHLDARSHAVVMNHHLDRDRATLRRALESAAPYVGVLGPRSRYERLLDGLATEGFHPTPGQLARVRSPIGLRMGAETPDEVALSIMGELMALRRGHDGGFLNGEAGRIHAPVRATRTRRTA